jgi:hypothetical protein
MEEQTQTQPVAPRDGMAKMIMINVIISALVSIIVFFIILFGLNGRLTAMDSRILVLEQKMAKMQTKFVIQ